MADRSAIEWTDATWNPVTGCTKVSPGCAHCYAEAVTLRFKYGPAYLPGIAEIKLHPDRLDQPLHWKRPRRIFVNSMSDLFHEEVPDDFIIRVFRTMDRAPQHTFQILTKRPDRMAEWFDQHPCGLVYANGSRPFPLPNVWLGVSVENQYWADRRLPLLAESPAAVRFVSAEPLLKPVSLYSWLTGHPREFDPPESWPSGLRGDAVNWVIAGGESGPRCRPMEADWVRGLRDECIAAGVPFFFKQWGGPRPGGPALLDGREWREFPQ